MNEHSKPQSPKRELQVAEPGHERVLARILCGVLGLQSTTEATSIQQTADSPSGDEPATEEAQGIVSPAPFLEELRTLRLALLVCCAIAIALWVLGYGASVALAAPGGGGSGGDAISNTIGNVRDYIGGLMIALGGLGFVVSLGLKAASPINENAQYLAHMGIKSSLIAVLGGAIVGPVISIVQGLAAG